MTSGPYFKKLGSQPGVQVSLDTEQDDDRVLEPDQVTAMVARLERGPIDRAFMVYRENIESRMGPVKSNLVRAIHEARMQAADVLDSGAAALVVARLAPDSAVKRYAVVHLVDRRELVYESPLYPVYGGDAFTQSIQVMDGSMVGIDPMFDAFDQALTVTGGSFPVVSYTGAFQINDAFVHGIDIVGGSFPSQLFNFSAGIESVSQSITITGGGFPNLLIQNGIAPELVSQTLDITGGTLT